jgi:hypothetical protein
MLAVKANGAVIPILGLGTWGLQGKTCARIVEQAIRLGYKADPDGHGIRGLDGDRRGGDVCRGRALLR